jgi:hypothetical protein
MLPYFAISGFGHADGIMNFRAGINLFHYPVGILCMGQYYSIVQIIFWEFLEFFRL